VQVTTWNCKGLNGAIKRGNIFAHLKKLGTNIAFLQETHLKNRDHTLLRKNWVGQVFHSSFNSKSRGTAIIISKDVPFILDDIVPDMNGRYIIVTGKLYNIPVVLANIYAPNHDDEQFISSFLATLPKLETHKLILGGDFNLVLNPWLDRSSNKTQTLTKSAKVINTFIDTYRISDPWRFLYPNQRKYSFFSPVHHTYTRIDYFLIDCELLSVVRTVIMKQWYYRITAPLFLN